MAYRTKVERPDAYNTFELEFIIEDDGSLVIYELNARTGNIETYIELKPDEHRSLIELQYRRALDKLGE